MLTRIELILTNETKWTKSFTMLIKFDISHYIHFISLFCLCTHPYITQLQITPIVILFTIQQIQTYQFMKELYLNIFILFLTNATFSMITLFNFDDCIDSSLLILSNSFNSITTLSQSGYKFTKNDSA